MEILFVSSKGSQYRYYKALSSAVPFTSVVVTLFPVLGVKLFNSGLTLKIVKEGIDFHLKRKLRKYKEKPLPFVVWNLYVGFSAMYFSIIYLKFRYYLLKKRPQIICIWNGHRLPEMAIRLAARGLGIKMAYFENGLLPNTTTMDFNGVNAFSSLPKSKGFYLDYARKQITTSLAETKLVVRVDNKKKRGVSHGEVRASEKYIFVPFQVNFDSQVIINSPRVNSMEIFYDMLINAVEAIDDKGVVFVIKEHPSDSRGYSDLYNKHPRIKFVNGGTEELIRNAEAIVTLNSSVGIEAAMLEKKVIVLGEACYAIEDMVLSVNTEKDFIDAINALGKWEPNLDVTRSFFAYLSKEYCLPGAWQTQIDNVGYEHLTVFKEKISRILNLS